RHGGTRPQGSGRNNCDRGMICHSPRLRPKRVEVSIENPDAELGGRARPGADSRPSVADFRLDLILGCAVPFYSISGGKLMNFRFFASAIVAAAGAIALGACVTTSMQGYAD